MKKVIFATLIAMSMISTSALASDVKLPLDSARSDIAPNNQKKVIVADFGDLMKPGQNAREMTIEALTANRASITASSDKGDKKICEAVSIDNPMRRDNGICVSAKMNPATITVATFKRGAGAPKNEHPVPMKEFVEAKMAIPAGGVDDLECHVKDGKNTGYCKIASSK